MNNVLKMGKPGSKESSYNTTVLYEAKVISFHNTQNWRVKKKELGYLVYFDLGTGWGTNRENKEGAKLD